MEFEIGGDFQNVKKAGAFLDLDDSPVIEVSSKAYKVSIAIPKVSSKMDEAYGSNMFSIKPQSKMPTMIFGKSSYTHKIL